MGHGWVKPNPNGLTARCGGPGMCRVCQGERIVVNRGGDPHNIEDVLRLLVDVAERSDPVWDNEGVGPGRRD